MGSKKGRIKYLITRLDAMEIHLVLVVSSLFGQKEGYLEGNLPLNTMTRASSSA